MPQVGLPRRQVGRLLCADARQAVSLTCVGRAAGCHRCGTALLERLALGLCVLRRPPTHGLRGPPRIVSSMVCGLPFRTRPSVLPRSRPQLHHQAAVPQRAAVIPGVCARLLPLRGHHAAPRAGDVPGQDPGRLSGRAPPMVLPCCLPLMLLVRCTASVMWRLPAVVQGRILGTAYSLQRRPLLGPCAYDAACAAPLPRRVQKVALLLPWCLCLADAFPTAVATPALPPRPHVPQVSVQYTGGRGAPSAPPFGGKEGVMDLLITENVFYGRDAQVGGGRGSAARRPMCAAAARLSGRDLVCVSCAGAPRAPVAPQQPQLRRRPSRACPAPPPTPHTHTHPTHPSCIRCRASTISRAASGTGMPPTTPPPQASRQGRRHPATAGSRQPALSASLHFAAMAALSAVPPGPSIAALSPNQ